jgi:hypothetical protein
MNPYTWPENTQRKSKPGKYRRVDDVETQDGGVWGQGSPTRLTTFNTANACCGAGMMISLLEARVMHHLKRTMN